MTANKKGHPRQESDLSKTTNFQLHFTKKNPPSQVGLSPRKQRTIAALSDFPEGVMSYDLGRIAGCLNIADQVMRLRRIGFDIACDMESSIDQDGKKILVGRYRLVEVANDE